MLKEDGELGLSFNLPDRLRQKQLDNYQSKVYEYLDTFRADPKNKSLTNAAYSAMIYSAAVESGIISGWQCDLMPDMKPSSVDDADAGVIKRVGEIVLEYMKPYNTIPPN